MRRFECVTVFDADPMDGGFSIEAWLRLWGACHEAGMNGPSMIAWPDGGALLGQPAIVVEVFDLIGQAMSAYSKSMRSRQNGG
jgi:hypothetical protein